MERHPGKRAAVYQRVSGDRQTTENQRPELMQLAAARSMDVVAVYDETVSAAKVRPAFEAIMAAAHAGKFDVLIVWSLDRFGQSMSGNLNAVLELDRFGVRVVSVREPWLDTAGPVRSLLIAIFSWVAEQERNRLIERTHAGLARARRDGKKLGRPVACIDIDEARVLVEVRRLSIREAAKHLGVGASTLHKRLKASQQQRSQKPVARPEPAAA